MKAHSANVFPFPPPQVKETSGGKQERHSRSIELAQAMNEIQRPGAQF
jgi:hypothetical protein